MKTTTNTDKIWNYLISNGLTKNGAAGLMGNLYSESACDPSTVEGLLIQRYDEEKSNYPAASAYTTGYKRPVNTAENREYNNNLYTTRLKNGTISTAEFLSPRSYTGSSHQYGYGLVQWTTKSRKQGLLNLCKSKGTSIDDLNTQLEWLWTELKSSYPTVLSYLTDSSKTLKQCSDIVLTRFEAPANASSMSATRLSYSQFYYDSYKGVSTSTMAKQTLNYTNFIAAVKNVYETAHNGGYTYGDSHGIPPTSDKVISCDRLPAKALWDMGYTDQPTSTSGRSGICVDQIDEYYQKFGFVKSTKMSDCKPGGVVVINSGGKPYHAFVLVSVSGTTCSKYDMGSQARIESAQPFTGVEINEWTAQGRTFGAVYNLPVQTATTTTTQDKGYLSLGDSGDEVKTLQTNLNKVMNAGLEVDGSFGNATDTAVKAFQKQYGLVVDGQYGTASKAKMTALLATLANAAKTVASSTATTTTTSTSSGYDVNKLIEVATAEIGYCEKASNSNLDSKTANAGSGNYTKYWRDLYSSYQGEAWCDCFVDWCFMKAYGADAAKVLECGGYKEFYTPTSAQCYKNKNQWSTTPKVGDQIFFQNSTRICHTGIVVAVNGSNITTIEGNTSAGNNVVVANGGCVEKKSYTLGNSRIAGFGHPNYGTSTTTTKNYLSKGDSGDAVKTLQTNLNKVINAGLTVDGDFGDATDKALRTFQTKYGLTVDGAYGAASKAKLESLAASTTSSTTVSSKTTTSSTLELGATGDAVKTLQTLLNKVINAGLEVDGSFGNATLIALKSFQSKYGLDADGSYGPLSKAKLESLSNSTSSSSPSQTPQWVGKATTYVNVRTGPAVSYPNLTAWKTLSAGNLVDVCDTVNGWYYVRISGKYFGYVNSDYITKA